MGEKTRASLLATCINALDKFMAGPVASILSAGESNFTPKGVEQGEIHVWDISQMRWQETGQFAQVAAKALYMRSLLGRDVRESPRPVIVVQDEAQLFCLPGLDSMAQSVSRSQKIIQLVITQNVPMLATALGGDQARQEVAGWLANFQTKILCQNSCHHTNEEMSRLIGQSRQIMWNFGGAGRDDFDPVMDGLGLARPSVSGGGSEQWQPQVRPEEFTRLSKGGPPRFAVEAVVYQGGRKFSNGKNWMRCHFEQLV